MKNLKLFVCTEDDDKEYIMEDIKNKDVKFICCNKYRLFIFYKDSKIWKVSKRHIKSKGVEKPPP